jgi:hypothetical protein
MRDDANGRDGHIKGWPNRRRGQIGDADRREGWQDWRGGNMG